MARGNFSDDNKYLPKGIIISDQSIEAPDGEEYTIFWSATWDIIRSCKNDNPGKYDLQTKEWIWHSLKDDEYIFNITGDHVIEYTDDIELINRNSRDIYFLI